MLVICEVIHMAIHKSEYDKQRYLEQCEEIRNRQRRYYMIENIDVSYQ